MKKRTLLDLLFILILVSIALFIISSSGNRIYTGFSFKFNLISGFITLFLIAGFSFTFTIIILVNQVQRKEMEWFISTLIALIVVSLGVIIAAWYYFSVLRKDLKNNSVSQNL